MKAASFGEAASLSVLLRLPSLNIGDYYSDFPLKRQTRHLSISESNQTLQRIRTMLRMLNVRESFMIRKPAVLIREKRNITF